jgi:hypothetical protein
MKKLLVFFGIFFCYNAADACDICGCGTGNNYIGILPDFHKHIVGLRYRSNAMLTHLGVGGSTTYLTTRETYRTVEAWSGWNLGQNFRLMASVPYSFNEKQNGNNRSQKNGLGDITLSGFYQLVNGKHSVGTNLLVQSLWVGGGVKFGTGTYNPEDKSPSNNNVNLFQLGTGSTDFLAGAMYDIRLQDAGLNLASNYKLNTANQYGYRYGNKFNLNAQGYYKFRTKSKVMIAPNAGVQYETAKRDADNGFSVATSGGNLLLGTAGLELAFGKMAMGANFQTPLSQNLANGIVKAKNRMMVHVAFSL